MAKTQEELNTIKEEIEMLNGKLTELTDEELQLVTGGVIPPLTVQQVALITTRTVSLIGLDGKPIGNPSSSPLQDVVNPGQVPGAGQSVILNK